MQESVLESAKRWVAELKRTEDRCPRPEMLRLAQALVEIAHESELACKYPEQSATRLLAIQHILNARGDA